MPLAATRPTASGSRGTYDDPIKHTSSYQQQQGMHLGGQPYPRSEQQPLPALHPLLGAHPRLKYAQASNSPSKHWRMPEVIWLALLRRFAASQSLVFLAKVLSF
jgi:hypothetical protein